MTSSGEYLDLKKHKIMDEELVKPLNIGTNRAFAPSSKHLHLHNITTENIKHSLCNKPKSKSIVLSRNNENTFSTITQKKEAINNQTNTTSSQNNLPLKTNQKDGSILLDELQETEVKNIFKRYFPRGTKVSHARCGCGYLHPYISLPTDSNGNVTFESEPSIKSSKTPHSSNKIIIRRNVSSPTTETANSRVTNSNSPFFIHSERRSKPFDLILGSSQVSHTPIHIELPSEEDFSDEEELTKLLNFSSNITPNKLGESYTNESLQEMPSRDFLNDTITPEEAEEEKLNVAIEKYSQLREKLKEMENELKLKDEKLSLLEEEKQEKLKEMEIELKSKEEKINTLENEKVQFESEKVSFEEKINDLNDKIVELVYCVPPVPETNTSFVDPTSQTENIADKSLKEESTQVENLVGTMEASIQADHFNPVKLDVKEASIQAITSTNDITIQTLTDTSEISTNTEVDLKETISVPCSILNNDENILKERNDQINQLIQKLAEREEELEKISNENQALIDERDFISQNVSYGIDANKKVLELLEKELERIKNEMHVQSEDFARERKILENEIEMLQNQDTKNQESTASKISDLEKELNDARTVVEMMTAEVNRANESSSKLTKDLEEIQAHKQNLESDLDSERRRYEELLDSLQERIDEDNNNKEVIANTSQQVKIMNSELEALKKMLEEKQEIVDDLEGKLTESQQNVEELLTNKQDVSDSRLEQLDEQSAQIESLLDEVKEKEEEVSSLRRELAQSQILLGEKEEKLQEKDKEFNIKCKEISQMSRDIDFLQEALNGRNNSENDQIKLLEERNADLMEDLKAREEEIYSLEKQLEQEMALQKEQFLEETNRLQELIENYAEDIKIKDTEISDLETENQEVNSLLESNSSTIQEYSSRLEKLEEENMNLKEQLQSVENDFDHLKEVNRELLSQLQSEEGELRLKLEQAVDDSERYKALLEESKQEIDVLNDLVCKLKMELNESLSTIDDMKKSRSEEDVQDLLNQINELKNIIESKEGQLSEKEKEIEKSQEDLEKFMENYNSYKDRAEMEISHFQEQISLSFNDLQEKNEIIANLQTLLEKQQMEHDREMQNADQVLKSLQERIANTTEEIEKLNKDKELLEKSLIAKSQNSAVESKELNDLKRENYELKHQFDDYRQSNDKMQQEVERLLEQLTKGGSGSSPSSTEGSPEMTSKTPTHRNGKFSAIIQTSTPLSHTTTIDLWKQLRSEILRLKQKNVELAQQIMQVNKTKEETISKYEKELRKIQMDITKYRKVEVDFEKQKTQLMQVEEYGRKLEENNNLLNNHLKQLEYEKSNLLRLQEQTRSELQQLKDNLETLTAENQRLIKAEKKRNLGDKVTPPTSLLPSSNTVLGPNKKQK